jgi:hypothetical protein
MFRVYHLLVPIFVAVPVIARDITFPPVSGFSSDQATLGFTAGPEISYSKFAGLSTYANLPYVHCLAPTEEGVEKFDIAILGAPFDTVCLSFFIVMTGKAVNSTKTVSLKRWISCPAGYG